MRVAVTGRQGQVALSLAERAGAHGATLITIGRPEVDFLDPSSIGPALAAVRPDVIVNAAAYTAVDLAEAEEAAATAINGVAAGAVAEAAARLGIPVVQISTDYVFDGTAAHPYREEDPVAPLGAYGRSKRAGELAVSAATGNHAILRTAWVHSPFGKNFVRTMLMLGKDRSEVRVVADQRGNPTYAPDIADGVLRVARNLVASPAADLRGVFHMTGAGEAVWADVAEAVFALAQAAGRPPVRVHRITSAEYPTPARRPANSRLDCARLAHVHGVTLPDWHEGLSRCVSRLLEAEGQGARA